MDNLAIVISLVSIVCLIIGLIKPSAFKNIFKQKANRKFLSFFFACLTILSFVVFGITSDKKEEDKKSLEAQTVKEQNSVSTPATVEDKIKELIKNELTGNNNHDKSFLRDINFVMDNKEASIIIKYNADKNITNDLTKVGMESRMSDLYYKLYKSGFPIKSVSVCSYLTFVDKYGNKADDIVYTTILGKDEASKINWTNDENEIKTVIIPQVWTTNFIHPALTND
jgi:hypothetical protein